MAANADAPLSLANDATNNVGKLHELVQNRRSIVLVGVADLANCRIHLAPAEVNPSSIPFSQAPRFGPYLFKARSGIEEESPLSDSLVISDALRKKYAFVSELAKNLLTCESPP